MDLHHGIVSTSRCMRGAGTLTLLTAALCMVLGVLQVRRGLAPVDNLRSRLAGLHQGRIGASRAITGEIQPLVNDLNALLEHRERAVRARWRKPRSRARSENAVAILAQEAARAGAAVMQRCRGDPPAVDRMRRQVDYHLAHARAAASARAPRARCSIGEAAEGLARALLAFTWSAGLPSTCTCRWI